MTKLATPIYIVLFCMVHVGLFGQQAPQYSLYMLNPYAYNAGAAGMDNTLTATGVYRQQWSGLNGAPVTQHVNAHMPLYMISSGVGIKMDNDAIGAHRTTSVQATYNYQLALGRKTVLSAGASVGYLQYALDGSKLRTVDGEYETVFTNNDDLLPDSKISAGMPMLELGLWLQQEKWAVGIASQPVYAPGLDVQRDSFAFKLSAARHYIFSASAQIDAGDKLQIKPSVLAKTDMAETQVEISLLGKWQDNIFAGASWRGFTRGSRDAVVILAGFKLNEKLSLAYGFDIPMSPLQAVQRGSHEIMLHYSLNKPIGAGKTSSGDL